MAKQVDEFSGQKDRLPTGVMPETRVSGGDGSFLSAPVMSVNDRSREIAALSNGVQQLGRRMSAEAEAKAAQTRAVDLARLQNEHVLNDTQANQRFQEQYNLDPNSNPDTYAPNYAKVYQPLVDNTLKGIKDPKLKDAFTEWEYGYRTKAQLRDLTQQQTMYMAVYRGVREEAAKTQNARIIAVPTADTVLEILDQKKTIFEALTTNRTTPLSPEMKDMLAAEDQKDVGDLFELAITEAAKTDLNAAQGMLEDPRILERLTPDQIRVYGERISNRLAAVEAQKVAVLKQQKTSIVNSWMAGVLRGGNTSGLEQQMSVLAQTPGVFDPSDLAQIEAFRQNQNAYRNVAQTWVTADPSTRDGLLVALDPARNGTVVDETFADKVAAYDKFTSYLDTLDKHEADNPGLGYSELTGDTSPMGRKRAVLAQRIQNGESLEGTRILDKGEKTQLLGSLNQAFMKGDAAGTIDWFNKLQSQYGGEVIAPNVTMLDVVLSDLKESTTNPLQQKMIGAMLLMAPDTPADESNDYLFRTMFLPPKKIAELNHENTNPQYKPVMEALKNNKVFQNFANAQGLTARQQNLRSEQVEAIRNAVLLSASNVNAVPIGGVFGLFQTSVAQQAVDKTISDILPFTAVTISGSKANPFEDRSTMSLGNFGSVQTRSPGEAIQIRSSNLSVPKEFGEKKYPAGMDFGTAHAARIREKLVDKDWALNNVKINGIAAPDRPQGSFREPNTSQYRQYGPIAKQAAKTHGVPTNLFVAMINQESGFRPTAQSSAGAQGIAQIIPSTQKSWGVKDPFNPAEALQASAKNVAGYFKTYLKDKKLNPTGSMFKAAQLTLAAYNSGPGNVKKYGGIPPFPETQRYVKNIMAAAGPLHSGPPKKRTYAQLSGPEKAAFDQWHSMAKKSLVLTDYSDYTGSVVQVRSGADGRPTSLRSWDGKPLVFDYANTDKWARTPRLTAR